MSSDPKPVGGPWHKAARGEVLSPPKGASEETLVPQLFTASVPDPRTVQIFTSHGTGSACVHGMEGEPR